MNHSFKLILVFIFLLAQFSVHSQYEYSNEKKYLVPEETIDVVLSLFLANEQKNKEAFQYLEDTWVDGYIPMLLDVIYMSKLEIDREGIIQLMEKKTKQKIGDDLHNWLEWIWNKEDASLPFHGDWLASVYKHIDPKFEQYFLNRTFASLIRLDEIRWGGVEQDGIPPLRNPKMLLANEADYLDDENLIFGVSINGDHRAYPKRILAWHELFVDEIGGESIAGVYCTLCGTVIAYNTTFNGQNFDLGTSGFLYRSNKLMYDKATQSLWNTIEGKPVIGPLITAGIELKSHAVVTTTWGEWKKLHPDTKVLSLDTGHQRNYNEGEAYQSYFATDQLMFNVPALDNRLLNKDEVLIIRAEGYKNDPLAISSSFLKKNRVYQNNIGVTNFVVLTDNSGGNRVYESKDLTFKKLIDNSVKDADGNLWQIEEERLIASDGKALKRLPYHRIFWFAWYNIYTNTRLVK